MSTWVLLRGLMREARHWGDFPSVLGAAIADARVVSLDLPGNGPLHRMPSPMRVEQMAQYCRQELRARGIAPPYHVLALSLGAMVAVAWATAYPQELSACVLINTSLRPLNPFYRRLRPHNYLDVCKLGLMPLDQERQERLILRLTSCRGDAQWAIVDAWVAYRREYPVSRRNALRQLSAAIRYRAPATPPVTPMLVLAGAQDKLVDARCSQQLASRWQTAFAMHPGAGHDLPLDDAHWVAQQVRDWLTGATGQLEKP
ncbi:alpha/beta fold hydrolase [Paraherbaspirillum soli]|uniref:Alpha/beta fold hydrolase n=1 Tax=Paraherbaspirillum soli TaxID=631222 RepID=A0ABW0M9I9_9BURK